jgi:hypothetical protein
MTVHNIVFLTIGSGSCIAGGYFLFQSTRRRRSWSEGEGVIIGYHENEESSFFPQVEFTLSSGEKQRFQSACSGSPQLFPVGSHVRVLYAPDSPMRAEIVSFSNLWLLPIVFLGFGVVCILIGIYERFVVN